MTPAVDGQFRCPDCQHHGLIHPGPLVQGAVCFGERCRCQRQTGPDGFSFPVVPAEGLNPVRVGEGMHLPAIPAQTKSGHYGRSVPTGSEVW